MLNADCATPNAERRTPNANAGAAGNLSFQSLGAMIALFDRREVLIELGPSFASLRAL
jgi:hypothetical protein